MDSDITKAPRFLYRYRSLAADRDFKRAADIIRDHNLYLAAAEQYNDPFECRFTLSLDATDDEKTKKFKMGLMEQNPELPESEATAQAQRMLDPNPTLTEEWEANLEHNLVNKYRKTMGLLSLTAKNDDTLMWSHYADAHQGICLEFDTEVASVVSKAAKVRYQKPFPVVRYFTMSPDDFAYAMLLTKNFAWEYEAEWRVFAVDQARTSVPFPPEALTGVILGAHLDSNRRNQILELLRQRNQPIRVHQMHIHKGEYRLFMEEDTYQVGL